MSGLEDVSMSPPPAADEPLAGEDDEFTLMEGVFDTPAEPASEPVREALGPRLPVRGSQQRAS
jgi:hypothetical protein